MGNVQGRYIMYLPYDNTHNSYAVAREIHIKWILHYMVPKNTGTDRNGHEK